MGNIPNVRFPTMPTPLIHPTNALLKRLEMENVRMRANGVSRNRLEAYFTLFSGRAWVFPITYLYPVANILSRRNKANITMARILKYPPRDNQTLNSVPPASGMGAYEI